MGVRIRYEFTSDYEGVEWRCDIHDSDYAAAINTATGNGFNITYNGNGDAPLANIKGSSCQLNLVWREDDSFYSGFINDLKAANEHEFALVIYKDNALYWVGNITGDSLMWNNENTSRELTINAIDGLGRLRDMNYDAIIPGISEEWTDNKQVFEVILDLLSLNNLDQFWGASDAYIEFEPHWILNTSYRDFLDRLSIPRLVFLDKSNEVDRNNYEPKSAYDCLEIILTHLNMRILHSDGRYFLQQVMGMSGANAAYRYTYYKGNTPVSSSPYKWWQAQNTNVARNSVAGTDVDVLAGGKFSYFQGLQRAEMDVPDLMFYYTDIQNTYAKTLLNPTNCPFTESTDLGLIKGGSGTGKRLGIFVSLRVRRKIALAGLINRYFIRLTIKVSAGTYRLYDSGSKGKNLSWTTTAADTITIERFKSGYDDKSEGFIYVETPEIPWSIESTTLDITYDIIDPNTGASYTMSPVTLDAVIENVNVSYLAGDDIIKRSKLYIPNPTITDYENNTLYKHPDYLLDDVGLVSASNSFQLNTTTTTFADVTSVDSGHNTDEVISETILQDAMSLQIHPIQVYEGAISGEYEPYKTFQYGSDYYVFNGGSFDAKNDEWNCQWWQSSPELGTIGNPDRDNGKGFEYDGDEVFKPYRKLPTPWDHYGDVKDAFYLEKIGAGGGNFGSTITSLPLTSASQSLFKNDDTLVIFNPDTLENLAQVVLSADVDATDTTMSIDSVTLANNIPPDAVVMLKGSEGFATPMLRTLKIDPPATVTPTTSDFIYIADASDGDKLKKIPYVAPPTEKVYGFGADSGFDIVVISASSTYYVTNQGAWNTSKLASGVTYNTSTNLYTNSTGRTIRLAMHGQLEVFSFSGSTASYIVSLGIGIDGSVGAGQNQDKKILLAANDIINVFYMDDVPNGSTFGLYIANKTNTDNIEWARVRFMFQEV